MLSTLPAGSVTRDELRSLREAIDDAEMATAFQLRDVTAAVEQAADTFNQAKRHGAPGGDPLQAAATAFATASATPAEDSQTWPVIDQVELQWRMRQDGITIRLGLTLGAGKSDAAADRQYMPWLNDTITAVDRPMSVAALAIVAEQWRTRRAPYLRDTRANVRIGEPTTRPPATWWWRLRHGDQPTTPITPG